jgi:hypothetical protein
MKFRKKPIEIEAIVWNNNFDEIFNFMEADNNYGIVGIKNSNSDILQIRTLEGVMDAQVGDYIIRGIKGEYYPCKPDIFEMTYELASTSSQQEISDEEIEKGAEDWQEFRQGAGKQSFERGAKWYREQLKQRQCNK